MMENKRNTEESDLLKLNHEISDFLTATTSLSSTLDHLLSVCCKIEGIHAATLYLTNKTTDGLTLVSHCGLGEKFLKHVRNYDFSTPETIFVRNGEPMYFQSFEMDMDIFSSREAKQQGMNLIAMIPVEIRQSCRR